MAAVQAVKEDFGEREKWGIVTISGLLIGTMDQVRKSLRRRTLWLEPNG